MKATSLILIASLLCGALAAQSGTWSRVGNWHMSQSHQVVEFNGRLWAFGGANLGNDEHTFDEIRSSADGINWTLELEHAPFGPRANHAVVVFNGRVWVLGGTTDQMFARKNDVWSSADGINWSLETASAPWAARANHAAVAHDGRIWVLGGRAPGAKNDVWSSPDGVNWTEEANASAWSGRYSFGCVSFNGRIWVVGGQSLAEGETRDVWSTTNGVNWTLELATAPWARRSAHATLVFNGKLWVMGGSWNFRNDVWVSDDGINWTSVTQSAGWGGRRSHAAAAFNNRLWIFGGYFEKPSDQSWLLRRDVWSSVDGAAWQQESVGEGWSPRFAHGAVSFNGRMWVIGGYFLDQSQQGEIDANAEVWSSADGASWTLETVAPFIPRANHATVVFNNRIWVMGGLGLPAWWALDDVWSSGDGVNWVQHAPAPWGEREALRATVFNGRIFVVGGNTTMGMEYKDVWSSVDGTNWRRDVADAPFGRRRAVGLAAFNNRLWVIGGENQLTGKTDVWSSPDGASWTLESSSIPCMPRGRPSVTEFHGRLWLTGGYANFSMLDDTWTSTDGITWTQIPSTWYRRGEHQTFEHNGKLCMIGGGSQGHTYNDVWVFEPETPPQITSTPPAAAAAGATFTYNVTATGSPAPVISASGLPGWLSLSGSTLTGTPSTADVGTTGVITVTAANSAGRDDQMFQINVVNGPVITSTPPVTATINTPWSYDVVAGGVPAPVISVSGLPAWLSLSGDTISGTPQPGDIGLTGIITVTATNSGGIDTQDFQIDVQGLPPQITSAPVLTVNEGALYSYIVSATGTPAPMLSASGLPAWLSFNPATGEFGGTPTSADVGFTGLVSVNATNGWGPDAVQSFTIEVQPLLSGSNSANSGAGCTAGAGAHAWWLLLALLPVGARVLRRRRALA
jgi:hypothetical protein